MDIQALLPVIRSQFSKLKLPSPRDKVYKDECLFSFDTPFSEGGLFVNIATWQGFGVEYYLEDARKTDHKLYLHQKWEQIEKPQVMNDAGEAEQPSSLAIGVPGGFMTESKYDIIKTHTLIVVTDAGPVSIQLPNAELPEFVSNILQAIIDHDGMRAKMQLDTWSADQDIAVSKYALTLQQLDSGKKISQNPSTWVCEASGQTENLWLNLSTGYIGGGRKNWDGSGGSGAALQHYLDTGRQYPLCVKLGTITRHGGDVWSYAEEEDTLVKDPLLAQHLSHWGIDAMQLEKTDKTMGEMEVDLNMKYDWSKILESGETLETLSGPGHVGLKNIGSSCYMNSVMQTLLSLPEMSGRYSRFSTPELRRALVESASADASTDFLVQMSKMCEGVLSGRYVPPTGCSDGEASLEKYVIAPHMFKQLVGKDHPEFSSGRQQDAAEYYQYFLQFMSRAERTLLPRVGGGAPMLTKFEYHVQGKDVCQVTQQVRRTAPAIETMLQVNIPLERAVNRHLVDEMEKKKARLGEATGSDGSPSSSSSSLVSDEEIKLQVPLQICLDNHFAASLVEGVVNPSLGQVTSRLRQTLMKTFPQYLMIKLNRYIAGPNWVVKKIDAEVLVPETLDLSMYRCTAPAEGEVEMPNGNADAVDAPASAVGGQFVPDAASIETLIGFGFTVEQATAALSANAGNVEGAANWLCTQDNLDEAVATFLAAQAVLGAGAGAVGVESVVLDAESLAQLQSFGFTADQARAALLDCKGNMDRAADWLFSRDDIDVATAAVLSAHGAGGAAGGGGGGGGGGRAAGAANGGAEMDDGPGTYSLVAIISHIGRSTDHGHYVCHIKKNGRWVLFNDEKVALSKSPPLDAGFMYLFKRDD